MINNVLQLHMNLMYLAPHEFLVFQQDDMTDHLPLCWQVSKQGVNHTEGNKQYLTHEMWI